MFILILALNLFFQQPIVHYDNFTQDEIQASSVDNSSDGKNLICDGTNDYSYQIIIIDGTKKVITEAEITAQVIDVQALFLRNTDNINMHVVPRFRTDDNCQLNFMHIDKKLINNYSLDYHLMDEVYNQFPISDPLTKYIIFNADASGGWGMLNIDDRPGIDNHNNMSGIALVGNIGYFGLTHEILHTLGAVQKTAPHTTGYGHCYDGRDVMCYKDNMLAPAPLTICGDVYTIDCGKDDYFSLNPHGYLAQYWNTANNRFLIKLPTTTILFLPSIISYDGDNCPEAFVAGINCDAKP